MGLNINAFREHAVGDYDQTKIIRICQVFMAMKEEQGPPELSLAVRYSHHWLALWTDPGWLEDDSRLIRLLGGLYCGIPTIVTNRERAARALVELYKMSDETAMELIKDEMRSVLEELGETLNRSYDTLPKPQAGLYNVRNRFRLIFDIIKSPYVIRILNFVPCADQKLQDIVRSALVQQES